jgi:hypothetical protein
MEREEILKGLQEALKIVTIEDIVLDFNNRGIDYVGMSDIEMYIRFFEGA